MFKIFLIIFINMVSFLNCGINKSSDQEKSREKWTGKKIYYIDSYHENYKPNIKTRNAFLKGLDNAEIKIDWSYLNAKNVSDVESLNVIAGNINKKVLDFKPDIIIVSDDAAMKYVIEPYFKGKNIPIVFIGINWTYSNPSPNMTGQLEVELIDKLINDLKKYSNGDRVGILTAETVTDRKNIKYYKDILNIHFTKEVFVKDFNDWKNEYKRLQRQVDLLIVRQNSGISGWDKSDAEKWILNNTEIPTGSPNLHMNSYVLLCYPKMNEEYGEFAAKMALRILEGTPIEKLPIEKNRKSNITANMSIAKKLNIVFPSEFLDVAHLINYKDEK